MGRNKLFIVLLHSLLAMQLMPRTGHSQQRPQYSQFMFNNLVINPAYAGAEDALSLTFINRNQWSGVEGSPVTQSFGAHTLIPEKNIGLGLTFIHDRIGVHDNLSVLTNYAYHIRLHENTSLSLGLQLGVSKFKSDYSTLVGSSNDPKLINSINETLLDFGTGIYFKSPKLDIGISAPQLLNKDLVLNDTLSTQLQRINVLGYGLLRIALSENLQLEPGVLLKYFPSTPLSFDVNLNLVYKEVLSTGISYRKDESIDFILKFQLTQQLQVGYAYDYPLQNAALLSNASHELMVHYLFRNSRKNIISPR